MSKGPIKLDSPIQRPINRGQPLQPGAENTRPAGIESLLGEVAHYYEEQLTMLNKELASARASAAQYQFQPQATQSREMAQLQTALDLADRERVLLRAQIDQAEEKIDSLANLYLAAYTLHRRHEWSPVMRGLTDVLVNQIGAESFAVFVCDNDGRIDAVLSQLPPDGAPAGEELAASLFRTEIVYDGEGFVADVPLVNADQVIGCIHIYRLLSQKRFLNEADKKLLSSLSSLAATAIVASSGSGIRTPEPKKIDSISDAVSRDTIRPPATAKITENAVLPDVTDVFKVEGQRTGDLATDLSEMPSELLDYSTLLNTPSELFSQPVSTEPISEQNKGASNGSETSLSDGDSSRFRVLSSDRPSSSYPPGQDYLRFVGSDVTAPGQVVDGQTTGHSNRDLKKADASGQREPGLLFRKSPIKRA